MPPPSVIAIKVRTPTQLVADVRDELSRTCTLIIRASGVCESFLDPYMSEKAYEEYVACVRRLTREHGVFLINTSSAI